MDIQWINSPIFAAVTVVFFLGTAPAYAGKPVSQAEVDALQAQVEALEAETQALEAEIFGPKTVFVTSDIYTANLVMEAQAIDPSFTGSDGLMAADFICSTVANNSGLGNSYVAYLSTVNVDAIDRLPVDGGPWVTLNGDMVASNRFDILSFDDPGGFYLTNPIDVTENGSIVPQYHWVFTSTGGRTGRYSLDPAVTDNCEGWTSLSLDENGVSQSRAGVGLADKSTYRWAEQDSARCNFEAALYCFER